jgi:predicted DsbA family dithiol-disulfide isomerase
VNAITPPTRPTIEVVHDLVCPWCRLGVHRLLTTLAERPGLRVDLIWRPFLLNPDVPRGASARHDHAGRRFGGEDRARRLNGSIAEIGRAEGLFFAFERLRGTPSSVDAHRLVRWAALFGRATETVVAVFDAHFQDGRNIADGRVLADLADRVGLDAQAARAFLANDAELGAVQAENLRAHRIGINGVPCFVVAGRHAIAGAQEAEVLARMLDVAAVEAAATFPPPGLT